MTICWLNKIIDSTWKLLINKDIFTSNHSTKIIKTNCLCQDSLEKQQFSKFYGS